MRVAVLPSRMEQMPGTDGGAVEDGKAQIDNTPHVELAEGGFYYEQQLTELLPRLRLDPSLASFIDVVLIVEGKRFEAHRVVLASASPVLAAMFSNGMRETRMREITLHDIDVRSWSLAQDFIYTGKLPEIRMGAALKLLKVAAMYQMDALIPVVVTTIEGMLFPFNCCQVFSVAEALDLRQLKSQAEHLVQYHYHWISTTRQFRTIDIESFRQILKSRNLIVRSEVQVFESVLHWVFGTQTVRNNSPAKSDTMSSSTSSTTATTDDSEMELELDFTESESDEEVQVKDDRSCHLNELLGFVDLSNMTDADLKYVARMPGIRTSLNLFFDKVLHRLLHSPQGFEPTVDCPFRPVRPRYSELTTCRFVFNELQNDVQVGRVCKEWRLSCLLDSDGHLRFGIRTVSAPTQFVGIQLCIVFNGQVAWIGEHLTLIPRHAVCIPDGAPYVRNRELIVFLSVIKP